MVINMKDGLTCGHCCGSKMPGALGVVACEQNRAVVYNSAKYVIASGVAAISTMIAYFSGIYESVCNWYTQPPFAPFALSSDYATANYKMNVVEVSHKMEGTPENDLMVTHPDGSKAFAKGGLNYVIAGDGPDKLYYSLCSTDIIGNKVGVIENFNANVDKLFFFCTNTSIFPENITIIHDRVAEEDVTYIKIAGANKTSAIALIGDIPLEVSDIMLNHKWAEA